MTKADKKRFAELLQRVMDVYSGAMGEDAGVDGILAGLSEAERILPALKALFEEQRPQDSHLWAYFNMAHYASPKEATEFLFRNGIRAQAKVEQKDE